MSGGLNHLVPRHAGGAQWTWKTVTVVVNPGAVHRRNGEVQEWKRGEHIKNYGAANHVRQNSGRNRAQEHVAGCRREKTSRVSIPHHTSWDLFKAYIMNRKKEKSVLRKERNVRVLDLFRRCQQAQPRQSSTSPWKLTQSIKLQTEESKGNELRSTAANQFF